MFDDWLYLRLELAERPVTTRRDLQAMSLIEFVRRHTLLDMLEEKRLADEAAVDKNKAPFGTPSLPGGF